MNHGFSVEIAIEYGVDESIVLENFYFWLNKNMANKKNFHDGTYWTYNSQKALSELFPYWNRQKVQRILSKLEEFGLLQKGNYNKLKYDRTTWYSLTNKGLSLFGQSIAQKWTMEDSEMDNALFKSEQPIPDINTVINTDINTNTYQNSHLEWADILKSKILQVNPKNKCKSVNLTKWANDIRLMQDSDERTDEELHNIIDYIFTKDDFWRDQIQSPTSLRKHWDKIYPKVSPAKSLHKNLRNALDVMRELEMEDSK